MAFFEFATIDSIFILQVALVLIVIILLWRLSHLEEIIKKKK